MPLPATVPNGVRSAIRIPPTAAKRCSPGSTIHSCIGRTLSIDRSPFDIRIDDPSYSFLLLLTPSYSFLLLLLAYFFLLLCALLLLWSISLGRIFTMSSMPGRRLVPLGQSLLSSVLSIFSIIGASRVSTNSTVVQLRLYSDRNSTEWG